MSGVQECHSLIDEIVDGHIFRIHSRSHGVFPYNGGEVDVELCASLNAGHTPDPDTITMTGALRERLHILADLGPNSHVQRFFRRSMAL